MSSTSRCASDSGALGGGNLVIVKTSRCWSCDPPLSSSPPDLAGGVMGRENIAELSAGERPGGVGWDTDGNGEGDLLVRGRPRSPRCVDTGDGRAVE